MTARELWALAARIRGARSAGATALLARALDDARRALPHAVAQMARLDARVGDAVLVQSADLVRAGAVAGGFDAALAELRSEVAAIAESKAVRS